MPAELLNHRHCKHCDRATPYSQELCSDECEAIWKRFQKKRARMALLMYGAGALMVLLLIKQVVRF